MKPDLESLLPSLTLGLLLSPLPYISTFKASLWAAIIVWSISQAILLFKLPHLKNSPSAVHYLICNEAILTSFVLILFLLPWAKSLSTTV